MKSQFIKTYADIISLDNLLGAWGGFLPGKRNKNDVQEFSRELLMNLTNLHLDLFNKIYRHSNYTAFNISDPKPRSIHKAQVRDRVLHHAIYRILYPFFDQTFIHDSYTCRIGKGTHKAVNRFRQFAYKVSKNHTRSVWVLKCDIRKFFASIDQITLMKILKDYICDDDILGLLSEIVRSFYSTVPEKGLPLGNLTSQLLVNVYMNEFDQFVKHRLKVKYYIRYADDFVIMSEDRKRVEHIIPKIRNYLSGYLKLQLHPDKISIKTIVSGADYLGWVHFPDYRVLRTATKRKMFRNIKIKPGKRETVQSYLGLLKHGNAKKLEQEVRELEQILTESKIQEYT